MESSFNRGADSIGTDRLKKAIEKNRSKQKQRNNSALREISSLQERVTSSSSERESIWRKPQSRSNSISPSTLSAPRAIPNRPSHIISRNTGSNVNINRPGRRSIGLGEDNIELDSPLRRARMQAPANPAYSISNSRISTKVTAISKSKFKSSFLNTMIYLGWGFCLFLALRLVFANRGAYEFYSRHKILQEKIQYFEDIKVSNDLLEKDINMIKKDRAYQKKLVRDNLGFISKNEFLILFPKESYSQSN